MQKAQSMLQFMLNYSFPHAASFHHRDSLSTSYFPIVGPAAERHWTATEELWDFYWQAGKEAELRTLFHTPPVWVEGFLSLHYDRVYSGKSDHGIEKNEVYDHC